MSTLRNKVNLIGRLGAKPEIQTLTGGYIVTRFPVATKEYFKDKTGEWKENTQWHNVVVWGKLAERLVKIAGKGVEIALEGKLINKQYESKTGEKKYTTEIEMNDFMLLTSKAADQSENASN